MTNNQHKATEYCAPMLEMVEVTIEAGIAQSVYGGTTEDMGDFEELFGNENY